MKDQEQAVFRGVTGMKRRGFLRMVKSIVVGWIAVGVSWRRPVAAQLVEGGLWTVRRVAPGDEDQLLALMKSCVDSEDSFHGLCSPIEWTRGWAEGVVSERPRSKVITLNGTIVAYQDLPSKQPETFGEETVDYYERAFWCGAAGVRLDLVGKELAVEIFRRLLYEAFSDAMSLGYEYVRAAAPWEQHPYLPKPFTAYPGLTSESFEDEKGMTKFLLEWRLKDAVSVLADEGADQPLRFA